MLKISKLYCRSFDLDHLDLFWEVEDFDARSFDVQGIAFYVLRSESPGGPYDTISGPLRDQYRFRDTSPALLHKWRTLYYKLKAVNTPTGETVEFGPTSQQSEPDLIALEIVHQENILYREFIGRRCYLFPVRTFGPKCFCFAKISGRRTRSNCPTCFDTGYLGGYLAPIECFPQIDPTSKKGDLTPLLGEQQTINTSARLISFPPVKPKDILVEPENKRWRVLTVTSTQRLRAVVRQELTLYEISHGDMEFQLPLNLDLSNFQASAERNYTNPQHDDDHEDMANILAVYGYRPRGSVR